MPRRPMPPQEALPVIEEILDQAAELTRDIEAQNVRLEEMRRQRRLLFLRAFEKGSWYAHIAEHVGIDQVNVYRGIEKARVEQAS